MDRSEFIADAHVARFVQWLIEELPRLKICLNIRKSRRFVPNGVTAECEGLQDVLAYYSWAGDWAHSKTSLQKLATALRSAITRNDNQATLAACLEVLRWGGVRGSVAFLTNLASNGLLVDYLKTRSPLFSLQGAQRLSQLDQVVIDRFDAGMTKIFSLIDDTGSPIYDSRVGAAMAMLYQCFLHSHNEDPNALLNFPSGSARGNQIRNPGDLGGGLFNAPQFYTKSVRPHKWAQFQLKLGWIIQEILSKAKWFEKEPNNAGRCRAFEACLFMIGYDLRSISGNASRSNPRKEKLVLGTEDQLLKKPALATKAESGSNGWVPSGHPFKQVLKYFLEFRKSNQISYDRESFRNWLMQDKNFKMDTAKSYVFPLREMEFDLVDRTIEELDCIAIGGQTGLECVLNNRTLVVDERAWVCIVDAWIVGKLFNFKPKDRNAIIRRAGFAGTENACNTLITVGRAVGEHFNLLNQDGSPTQIYKNAVAEPMDDLNEALIEAIQLVMPHR